jgi:hypothetical protein
MSLSIEPLPIATELLLRNRKSVWNFLSTCVYTLDQADKWQPIKQYPATADKEYLKPIVEYVESDPLVALVKHRRMLITWTVVALGLWDAMFHEGRHIAFVSKKEEDSDELVRRAQFIYDNIPKAMLPIKPRAEYKYTQLRFPEINSFIKGYAQGPDQLRQHTCSRIMCDEIAFWPQARATFTSLKPTIEGGGKICLISTRYPGFFKQIIEDTLDEAA